MVSGHEESVGSKRDESKDPSGSDTSQPEGGYTVTSSLLEELVTEGETVSEALANAEDAFAAVVEIYEDRAGECLESH